MPLLLLKPFFASIGSSFTSFLDSFFHYHVLLSGQQYQLIWGCKKSLHGLATFVYALCDIKSGLRVKISIHPGGMKSLRGLATFVGALHDIEYSAPFPFNP